MRSALVVMAALVLGGCFSDDGYDPTIPTEIQLVSGSGQAADAGQPVTEPLTVRVINLKSDPVEGVTIEWFVQVGGGSVSASASTTDENGIALVSFTLGTLVGTQRVQAVNNVLAGSPVVFTATALPTGGGGPPTPVREL